MCEARFALASIAKPGAIAPTPASRQGRCFPATRGNVVLLRRLIGGLLWPFEFGAVDPHPVQNDSKFSSDGYLGFTQPGSLRNPDAPGFERDHLATRVSTTLAAS